MMRDAAQIPFEFFAPEAPRFDNFVVGNNHEVMPLLDGLSRQRGPHSAYVLWGGPGVGKSHLLAAVAAAAGASGVRALRLAPAIAFPDDPFVACDRLCVDDADCLSVDQQAWLFTAFNHLAQSGGCTVVTAATPPGQWTMREDIRTRLASGLALEVLPIPQDQLGKALASYAETRGFVVSDDVLTYLLSHARRDLQSLCQTLAGVDRLSLAEKRPVTIPLLRAYLVRSASVDVP